MIKLLRIDERLIHGQVVVGWSRNYNITHIIVANEKAAKNEILQKSLKMAAPAGMKVAIKTIADVITLLENPKAQSARIMLLVDNPKDAYALIQSVSGIDAVNIGNYGRIQALEQERVRLSAGLYANEEDKEWLQKIVEIYPDAFVQMTSDQTKEKLSDLV